MTVLLICAGPIAVESLEPIEHGKLTFTDLSHFRTFTSVLGLFLIVLPFIICYRSIVHFKELLHGR